MIRCVFCNSTLSFLKSVMTPDLKNDTRICFTCVRAINTLVADKYREQGWHVTKDALIVNTDYNTEKESA